MFDYKTEQDEQDLSDLQHTKYRFNSLSNEFKSQQNPFSFYKHGSLNCCSDNQHEIDIGQDLDNDSNGSPIEDISQTKFHHRLACESYSSQSFTQEGLPETNVGNEIQKKGINGLKGGKVQKNQLNMLSQQDNHLLYNNNIKNHICSKSQKLSLLIETPHTPLEISKQAQFTNLPTQVEQMSLSFLAKPLPAITSNSEPKTTSSDCTRVSRQNFSCLEFIGSQKQLDNDMQQMKTSFTQKVDQKCKKPTPIPIDITSKVQLGQNNKKVTSSLKRPSEIIEKLMGQRKKESFKALKEWEEKRNDSLDLHQNMVQVLLIEIDKRLKASIENFEIYAQFFKERAMQEEKYLTMSVVNTKEALNSNMFSKTLYLHCTTTLHTLGQQTTVRNQKIADFVQLLKDNIIQQLMHEHISSSQKSLLILRQKLSTTKNTLEKCTQKSQATFTQLKEIFSEHSTPTNDFFSAQMKFLRRCKCEQILQKQYGLLVLQFYHQAIVKDVKRSGVIREALITYTKGLKETYNFDMEKEEMEQLSKGEEQKLILQLYSFEEIFQDASLKLWKEQIGLSQGRMVGLTDFQQYLQNYKIPEFDAQKIILKKYQAVYRSKDSKSDELCTVIIAVDGFVHFLIKKQKVQPNNDPDISIPLLKKGIQLREQGGESVSILKKRGRRGSVISYFWDNTQDNVYLLKFGSMEEKIDFMEIVNTITK